MAYGKIYWQEFFLGGVSRDFSKDKLSEISLKVLCMISQLIVVQLQKKIYLIFKSIS